MSEFINTADVIGDDEMCDQIIMRTVTEYKEDRVTKVSAYAFYGCNALEVVELPNATDIGVEAFIGCGALTEIAFPKAKIIRHASFESCNKLSKLVFPCVTALSSRAFRYCSAIKHIDFPVLADIANLDGLGTSDQFAGCSSLVALILRRGEVCKLRSTIPFHNSPIASGTGYIYVPSALVDSYKSATNWSDYSAQFRALEDYTVDGTVEGELDETKI